MIESSRQVRTPDSRKISTAKLVVTFLTIFSLALLVGPGRVSTGLDFTVLPLTTPQVGPCGPGPGACACLNAQGAAGYCWLPAGPSMDTELATIFTDQTAELADIQSSTPLIDLTDTPLPPSQIFTFTNSTQLATTSRVADHGYMEIEFDLAANFWACNFQFGNSLCGVQIRQGISHLFDKSSFTATDPSLAGVASAIDNPLPTSNGGLVSPNPCAWDSSFLESGAGCVVGGSGGTAYHLGAAAGANGIPWLEAPGSADLNAAAKHFVNAGLATGFNPSTSVLTGISSSALSDPVNFFIRNDDPARLDLGNGVAGGICYLFTGSYTTPCGYLTVTRGPATAICQSSLCCFPADVCGPGSWGMYTARYSDVYPFDSSLYYGYNSKFVNGASSIQQPTGPCSAQSVPTNTPGNIVYLCNSSYDTLSSGMEFASCLALSGDPVTGSTSNNSTGTCPAGGLSAVGAGLQAENLFGKGAYTIPVFETTLQFGYMNDGWTGVIDDDGLGMPNYFTWLNAWNPSPSVSGIIRQGFAQTTRSVSPFVASSATDVNIVGNIYDSLTRPNPLSGGQTVDWMAISIFSPPGPWSYNPPPGTTATVRVTLRSDLFFQDGRKVTSFDVAFSYLALKGTGAFMGSGAAPITGITILGPSQLDINLNAIGPFTLQSLTSLPIIPGAYWSNAGSSSWTAAIGNCTMTGSACYPAQYTINSSTPTMTNCALTCVFPASDMNVNVAQTSASYDPITAHTLVGSGPFECGPVTSSGSSSACSSSGTENPPVGGTYTLTRFGKGLAPGSSVSGSYFRSVGNLALYLWSEDTGEITHDFLNFSVIASCFGAPINLTGPCGHWQQGIGANGGPTGVGLNQVSIVNRFIGTNWVAPFNWSTSPPLGIVALAPVVHEGSMTLNPSSVAGCTSPYPTGGYDC